MSEEEEQECEKCKSKTSERVAKYSREHFNGHVFCFGCQPPKKQEQIEITSDDEMEAIGKEIASELESEKVEMNEEKREVVEKAEEGVSFFTEGALLLCKSGENTYELDVTLPSCTCPDFVINKQKQELCKHLIAAKEAGYPVATLPSVPEELTKALVRKDKKEKKAAKKEEEKISLSILDRDIDIPVQTLTEFVQDEESATKMIVSILGGHPQYGDVIEKIGTIEELSADVIISMAQHMGLRFSILSKELEVAKLNMGKLYLAVETDSAKRESYKALAAFMPDTDVVIRCKITGVAAWKDKAGNMHVGLGTKEELLTPYELRDIVKRGVNFIETKCETKAFKKSIMNALPITHDGLKSKIKKAYGWE